MLSRKEVIVYSISIWRKAVWNINITVLKNLDAVTRAASRRGRDCHKIDTRVPDIEEGRCVPRTPEIAVPESVPGIS